MICVEYVQCDMKKVMNTSLWASFLSFFNSEHSHECLRRWNRSESPAGGRRKGEKVDYINQNRNEEFILTGAAWTWTILKSEVTEWDTGFLSYCSFWNTAVLIKGTFWATTQEKTSKILLKKCLLVESICEHGKQNITVPFKVTHQPNNLHNSKKNPKNITFYIQKALFYLCAWDCRSCRFWVCFLFIIFYRIVTIQLTFQNESLIKSDV